VGQDGRVFVADTGNGRIQAFSPQGEALEEWPALLPSDDQIIGMEPNLAVLPDGRLAATYSMAGSIWLIDLKARKVEIRRVERPAIAEPLGLAVDARAGLWVSDRKNGKIVQIPIP
jgi:sugar lactone lactonase YvrE